MADADLFAPLSSLQWVDREQLKPNDYNPNKVNRENLKLLVQSIMTNGWTLPIVVRPDYTIIDGFHICTCLRYFAVNHYTTGIAGFISYRPSLDQSGNL